MEDVKAPHRVQQRRTKGWRKPENTVSVARPSRWGNPFTITAQECEEIEVGGICHVVGMQGRPYYVVAHEATPAEARAVAVELFANGVRTGRWGYTPEDVRRELAGKNLMCFCPLDQPCHADVLLKIANPAPICPECRDGKCRNCTGWALDAADDVVPCPCDHGGSR